MGPKKSQKNAFTFYLEDYIKFEANRGRTVSLKIAAEECGQVWKELPEEEKEFYKQKATAYKSQKNSNPKDDKQTNVGLTYVQLEKVIQQDQVKKEREEAEIKSTISNMDYESIKNHLFYVIHCNYYCKTEEGIYVPGEIAIVEFSLEDGIKRKYHTLVNPGPIPLGYGFEARQNIDEIHNLPTPPFDFGNSDYFGILNEILSFLEEGILPNGSFPPLFTVKNNINASENILQALSDSKTEDKNYFRVYHLEKMFFWLKNKCIEFCDKDRVGFPILANAEFEIMKDTYCFLYGISCYYHHGLEDKYFNCSLSVAQRHIYVICEHCCQYIDVELIPSKHCSIDCDVNKVEKKELVSQKNICSSEINESEFDGQSSYCGEISVIDFKNKDHQLDEKFNFEASFVQSNLSRNIHSSASKVLRKPGGLQDYDSDEEDFPKKSKGRGLHF